QYLISIDLSEPRILPSFPTRRSSDLFNTPLRAIRNVLTADGEQLRRYPFEVEQRFDSATIFLMQEALSRVMTDGTGRSAYNQIPSSIRLAGKTGTTNDLR